MGLHKYLRSNVKKSGVGGGRMTAGGPKRMSALKRTLKGAKGVIRKMKG